MDPGAASELDPEEPMDAEWPAEGPGRGGLTVRSGRHLWRRHPHVRSGEELTAGERAADILKHWFGTWSALFAVAAIIAIWVLLQGTGLRWDVYPFILLNLVLSCLAAVQGIILQISANRGDRINAEVALGTNDNTRQLLAMEETVLGLQQQQMDILAHQEEQARVHATLLAEVRDLASAIREG